MMRNAGSENSSYRDNR